MPLVDLPLSELLNYRPPLTAEADFDEFWAKQREVSAKRPVDPEFTQIDFPATKVNVFDVVYAGVDGTPIHGWYVVPVEASQANPVPVVVGYHGYSGDRGNPTDGLHWAAMGIASFTVDTRGQGGQSPDHATYPHGSSLGCMTKGILDKDTYYYKYAYMDCVRALDAISVRSEVDTSRIVVAGGSQGGGLTLAVAGIDSRPKLALPVFPYLCHFRRSVEMYQQGPYAEIRDWFRRFDPLHEKEAQVYQTLSYFDGMNFAPRVKAKTWMAITLEDLICPPSTCFAAYNHLETEKTNAIYHNHGHEGLPGSSLEQMRFVAKHV